MDAFWVVLCVALMYVVLLAFLRGARFGLKPEFSPGDFVRAPRIGGGMDAVGVIYKEDLVQTVDDDASFERVNLYNATRVNFALTLPGTRKRVQFIRETLKLAPIPVPPIVITQMAHSGPRAFECRNTAMGGSVYYGESTEQSLNEFFNAWGDFVGDDMPIEHRIDPSLEGR